MKIILETKGKTRSLNLYETWLNQFLILPIPDSNTNKKPI